MQDEQEQEELVENASGPTGWTRWLRPGQAHTAFSASLLLMASTLASGVLGVVRQKITANLFGATKATDAYLGAYELPDMVSYFLIGGVVSTTFISILSRYREEGNEAEGDRALCIILNAMGLVMTFAVILAEIFAPWYVSVKFPHFDEETARMCVSLTRVLLPAQLFFFVGGVFGSRLLARKIFAYQAWTPILYNAGMIMGALLFYRRLGLHSLAIGAVFGSFCGSFLMNAYGARREGLRWQPILDFKHPALKQWLKLALPLMIGQSLTTWDQWIRTFFASQGAGDISRLAYARQLFTSPMSILGPAAGAASMPFFASLFSQGKRKEFGQAVNRGVSRLMAVSFLAGGGMIALAGPLVDITLRGGRMDNTSAQLTAWFFTVFCLSLFLWTSQNLYSRAFYAAGDTLTPMVSGTIVTAVSIPIYWWLFHTMGTVGLAWASNIGILLHTLSLAALLQWKNLTPLSGLEYGELVRSMIAAVVGWGAIAAGLRVLPPLTGHLANIAVLIVGGGVWLGVIFAVLKVTGSKLPGQLLGRFAR